MKKQLSWKIIQYILVVYITLGLLITAIQIRIEYEGIKSELIASIKEISASFVKSLTISLWNYNLNGVQQTVTGITSYGSIIGAKVISDSGDIVAYGKIIDENKQVSIVEVIDDEASTSASAIKPDSLIEYSLALSSSEYGDEKLGTLYLYSSREFIIDRIKVGAAIIFLKLFLQILALAAVTLATIVWLVSVPLKKLKTASSKINPTSDDFSLSSNFVKESKLMERSDELGVLAKSLEAARVGLLDRDERINDYSQNLEKKVADRTRELHQKNSDIRSILTNIGQGILTFGDDLKIMPEHSSFLEKLFEQESLGGRSFIDVIFKKSSITENDLDQMLAAIYSIIDEKEFVFDVNEHLLIKECFSQVGPRKKILELEWQPILDDNSKISKMMLIVKDVTEIRKVKSESEKQKRDLIMIGEILKIGPEKTRRVIRDQIKYVDKCEKIIKTQNVISHEDISTLFRNLHTIKGNTRSLGLYNVVDTVHQAEQYYDKLIQDHSCKADTQRMLVDLDNVKEGLSVYEQLIEEKIGLKKNANDDSSNFLREFDKKFGHNCIHDNDEELLAKVKELIRKREDMRYIDLNSALEEIVNSLPEIAQRLNKEKPFVLISGGVNIKQEKSSIFRDIMTHLFRNSIDHGIEPPEIREQKGKEKSGSIILNSKMTGKFAVFEFYDDGFGLNLDAIKAKSQSSGTVSDEEVAEQIFNAGLSTASKVTNLSGRGVGMDAVKNFIESEGGKIKIEFTDKNMNGFRPFKYLISFPMDYFMEETKVAA